MDTILCFIIFQLCLRPIQTSNAYTPRPTPMPACDPLSADTSCSRCTERGPCLPDSFPFEPGYFNVTNVTLECSAGGHCVRGSVPIDPWLSFALKTQREIQIDESFTMLQIFDAHNAFNSRADGYGDYDTCEWPPPYDPWCLGVANQEFTFTDLLNMGVRGLEIDFWWCYGELRMAHLNAEYALLCLPTNRPFRDGMQEIADWFKVPGNENEILRILIDEDFNQTSDAIINEIIRSTIGDRVLTPDDLRDDFNGEWPTMRRMRETGKTVVINANYNFLHGGIYFHPVYWSGRNMKSFVGYPDCGGRHYRNTTLRFYGDATKFGRFYSGPRSTGVILDLTELVRCGVQISSADMVNPTLMRTGVYTWAKGEPSIELTSESCAYIRLSTRRWYATNDCERRLPVACVNDIDPDDWMLGERSGAFGDKKCKAGYTYSIPKNGFQQEKILELMTYKDYEVWIKYDSWLPVSSAAHTANVGSIFVIFTVILGIFHL